MGYNEVIGTLLDPVLNIHPFWGLLLLTLIINFVITIAYKYLTDQEALKSLKEESKELQHQMKELKDEPEKMMAIQKKSFENMMLNFKHNLKPMIITLLPIALIFGYLRAYYGLLGDDKIFLNTFGWLGTYVIFSLIFNIALRKLFKVH